ncbi:hypothetical protein ACSSS7_001870 [Eimeria intestinalis]
MAAAHAGRRLRTLLETDFLLLPGAYNGISARLVAARGFKGLYLSGNVHTVFFFRSIVLIEGAALTASQGLPDIGLAPLTDFTRVIREIATVTSLPILAEMIARTVHEYNAAGAAGLHLEDQQLPKRCGHLGGKVIVPVDEMVKKIEIGIKTSKAATDGDFIVCARTDAFAVEGFECAVKRASEYVAAGAEMIFPEGLTSEKAFADFAEAMKNLPGPAPGGGPFLLANMTEFGVTPLMKKEALKAAGFHCAIYPVSALRTAIKAMDVRHPCHRD